jgi:hypothetical protein
MVPQKQELDPPGKNEAKVIVYRDSWRNPTKPYAFLDQEQLLGFAESGAWFEVLCTPGEHFFYLHGVSSSGVRATLAEGRTYYLRADSIPELFHLNLELIPIVPGMREFDETGEILSGLERRELRSVQVIEEYTTSHAERLEENLAYLLTEGYEGCAVLRADDGR